MITWDSVIEWLIQHGIKILDRTVEKTKGESRRGLEKRTKTLVGVLIGISRVIIIVVAVLMILTEVGVPIGPMLAGFGIAGVAVGFGAQYLVRDLIAGIFILWENQFRVGDVAKIAEIIGTVEDVTLRKTVLRDIDGIVHHVPNGEIRVASNYTRHFSRVNLDISVSYDTDLDYAMAVINRVGEEIFANNTWHDKLITPPTAVRVNKLGDSGIDIKVMCDVKPSEQWAIMGEIRLRLKKAFDAEGIEIPWPHTKVFFGNSIDNVTNKK